MFAIIINFFRDCFVLDNTPKTVNHYEGYSYETCPFNGSYHKYEDDHCIYCHRPQWLE